jgi:hypothetical protein
MISGCAARYSWAYDSSPVFGGATAAALHRLSRRCGREVDARGRGGWGSGQLGGACKAPVVDAGDHASFASGHRDPLRGSRWYPHTPLSLADCLQLPPRPPVFQNSLGNRWPFADRTRADELERFASKEKRSLPQVVWRIVITSGYRHDITGLERRTDAPSHWLATVRHDRADM